MIPQGSASAGLKCRGGFRTHRGRGGRPGERRTDSSLEATYLTIDRVGLGLRPVVPCPRLAPAVDSPQEVPIPRLPLEALARV